MNDTAISAPTERLFVPFTIALFTQLKRVEGGSSPWSYLQLGTGLADMFLFILPLMILQAAIFRIDEISPVDLRTLNDLAWFLWIGTPPMVVWQMVAFAGFVLVNGWLMLGALRYSTERVQEPALA